jgi:adenosylhomocysteine nucleosidase
MSEVAYIAALEREVAPLGRSWRRVRREYTGRNFEFFEKGDRVLVCGGIGLDAARRAAEAAVALYHPAELVSVGFVGALDSTLRIGDVIEPALVVNARDGSRTPTGSGKGVLVTFSEVANAEQKSKLSVAYNAQAVDMEAAAVAQSAQAHGLRFRAVKAVSDEAGFAMPPMDRFTRPDGTFRTGSFVLYAAIRPAMWPTVVRLARNSAQASRTLCDALRHECLTSSPLETSAAIAKHP